jgi:hypothetical protein
LEGQREIEVMAIKRRRLSEEDGAEAAHRYAFINSTGGFG